MDVEKIVKKTFNLTLNEEEASFLCRLTGKLSGNKIADILELQYNTPLCGIYGKINYELYNKLSQYFKDE